MQSVCNVRNGLRYFASPLPKSNGALLSVVVHLSLAQAPFHSTRLLRSAHVGTALSSAGCVDDFLFLTVKAERQALKLQIDELLLELLVTTAIDSSKPHPRGVSQKKFRDIFNKRLVKSDLLERLREKTFTCRRDRQGHMAATAIRVP